MLAMKSSNRKKQGKFVYYISAPVRLLRSARDFYTHTLCDCSRIGHVGQVASYVAMPHQMSHHHSQLSRSFNSSTNDSKDIEDLRELVRLITLNNTTNNNRRSEDHDHRRKIRPSVEHSHSRSYSVGVGLIGRIDEDVPCDFVEVVAVKKKYVSRM